MVLIDLVVSLDAHVARALDPLASQPWILTRLMVHLSEANFLKVVPFVLVAGWCWNREPREANRADMVNGFAGIFLAVAIGRGPQFTLPFRARPIHDAALRLALPGAMTPDILGGWSSFPSDHAAIFAVLVGLVFAVVVVLLPRLYLGLHFMSDLVVGFAIGAAASWLAHRRPLASHLGPAIVLLARRRPAAFYTAAVLMLHPGRADGRERPPLRLDRQRPADRHLVNGPPAGPATAEGGISPSASAAARARSWARARQARSHD